MVRARRVVGLHQPPGLVRRQSRVQVGASIFAEQPRPRVELRRLPPQQITLPGAPERVQLHARRRIGQSGGCPLVRRAQRTRGRLGPPGQPRREPHRPRVHRRDRRHQPRRLALEAHRLDVREQLGDARVDVQPIQAVGVPDQDLAHAAHRLPALRADIDLQRPIVLERHRHRRHRHRPRRERATQHGHERRVGAQQQ